MVPLLLCPTYPTSSSLLTTSELGCSQPPGICSLVTWWLINTHRIPSLHDWFSFSQANIHPQPPPMLGSNSPVSNNYPCAMTSLLSLPLSGFPVSHFQVLFPNTNLCVQKLTLHQQCQSMNAHFLITQ